MNKHRTRLLAALIGVLPFAPAAGQNTPQGAGVTCPNYEEWMTGSPPAPATRVTHENATEPARLRWSMRNVERLRTGARIWRGEGVVAALPRRPRNIAALAVPGPVASVERYLELTCADAFIVMHRGRIVEERYLSGMQPQDWHAVNSVSKSFVGVLVEQFIAEGKIERDAQAQRYVPELAGSALGEANIGDLLDMLLQYQFGEGEPHTLGLQTLALQAIGTLPQPKGYSGPNGIYELLAMARTTGPSGKHFRYDNGNTETLAWVLHRVSGKDVAALVSERIWQPMGAEFDAMISLDPVGTPAGSGGIVATARDLARFGEMIRNGGRANGKQLLDPSIIARLMEGGDRAAFAASQNARFLSNHSYRSQWWVRHDGTGGAIYARGQFGQTIYVSPGDEMVVVQLGAYPLPGRSDATAQFATYDAIAAFLAKSDDP